MCVCAYVHKVPWAKRYAAVCYLMFSADGNSVKWSRFGSIVSKQTYKVTFWNKREKIVNIKVNLACITIRKQQALRLGMRPVLTFRQWHSVLLCHDGSSYINNHVIGFTRVRPIPSYSLKVHVTSRLNARCLLIRVYVWPNIDTCWVRHKKKRKMMGMFIFRVFFSLSIIKNEKKEKLIVLIVFIIRPLISYVSYHVTNRVVQV